ncbi:MAG: hypothetical protein U0R27_03110 [Candidatus Nanopelagicales bacterium]
MTITEPTKQTSTEPRKGHGRPAVLIAGGLLILGGAAIYAAGWTGLMGVNSVEVEGATTISPEELVALADIPEGTPMMRVDVPRPRVLPICHWCLRWTSAVSGPARSFCPSLNVVPSLC